MSTALPSLRQLRYLVAVADRLNFRAAAESCFVTQSTLSAGIKELERLLGAELVERDKRHVRLTRTGERSWRRGARSSRRRRTWSSSRVRPPSRCPAPFRLGRDPDDRAVPAATARAASCARPTRA